MNTILSAQSISYHLTSSSLLDGVSFALQKGDRIGLVGHNGCGKSTLLKLLRGDIEAHAGAITRARQCLVERVEQHLPNTLISTSMLNAVIEQLPETMRLADRWRAELLLAGMGFTESDWQLTAGTLSGGQHTRLLLARALIKQPDLLLLDEPSNHLDLPTLLWLEGFLKQWKNSFVLVSHDQRLLDNVTNCTWVMRDKQLNFFHLSCSQARTALREKDIADQQRYDAEQKEIERVGKSAKRLAIWGKVYDNEGFSRKAKSMEKRIDRLKIEQTELVDRTPWRLNLKGESLRANQLLALSTLDVRPAQKASLLFRIDSQRIKSGDRIAIVGRNGCGKSSLLRKLWQTYEQVTQKNEQIIFHPRCRLGYYDQSLQQLKENDTLLDALWRFTAIPDEQRKMALISAGFAYHRHTQQVKLLSGGERSRLLFVGLTLASYNLLFLDEPTNHLDMEGKEELAETLGQFSGGFILVTHDRELIEKSCNRLWRISNNRLEEWHDINQLYIAMNSATADNVPTQSKATKVAAEPVKPSHEDELLDRLMELEAALEADKARKEKHQKRRLQKQWQNEIAQISDQLGLN